MQKKQLSLRILLLSTASLLMTAGGCESRKNSGPSTDTLYSIFTNPPAESRPFVRWWWNGDCVELEELEREMDVLKAAGIGGVEINPIAHPLQEAADTLKCYEWLSLPWNQRVRATVEMARERDMIVDLIMGSGWPFGGEFLKEDQLIQGVGIRKIILEGPAEISLHLEEHRQLPGRDFGTYDNGEAPDPELFFLRMIPHGAEGITEMKDLLERVDEDGRIRVSVPDGQHDLYIGTFQKAYRLVMHGAPGSKGPVVDHYDREDVEAYMDRLADALGKVLEGKLGDHIRALFCDSIELSGANFTDDFLEEFAGRRGYRLEPFLPLVYYHPYEGYTDTLRYSEEMNKDIRRLRYDFNRTLVELFLEEFTATFDQWANVHGMQSRYQAYGMPWLMGMLDGYRMVDIPESNNWLFSGDAKSHGYWIWNKYCASGAHLSGSRLVACEAMTNTRGVFQTTLQMIKKNDDFNFITGMNHTVLHGFNYSPPEAGFPGWIRYGAYFSEQNSWWPFFHQWSSYNARLSAVFQNADPVVDIAIVTPEADIWQNHGLNRYPFYMNPWYHHDLWEGFSRQGISADYINEGVIQRASVTEGRMNSESCSYQLVILSSPRHMEPATLEAIRSLSEEGVTFLFVEHFPSASPGYFEKVKLDSEVRSLVKSLRELPAVHLVDPPADAVDVTGWTGRIARQYRVHTAIEPVRVDRSVYISKYTYGDHPVFFISNQHEDSARMVELKLELSGMDPWRWDPESGKRTILRVEGSGTVTLTLQPVESALIVLEKSRKDSVQEQPLPDEEQDLKISALWQMKCIPVHGEPFLLDSATLFDYAASEDPRMRSFAGEVRYSTRFHDAGSRWKFLDLGTEKHITSVILNGRELGSRWYGRHLYSLKEGDLKTGTNTLEVRYTTTLANYAYSLKDNRVAQRWIHLEEPESMGLTGPVRLLAAR